MSESPLKKFILTPFLISASVFAALTLPLAVFGNQQATIQLQRDTVFYGKLRDVALPYLGLASVFSLGAGVASVAIAGWQQSSRKSEEVEAQLSGLTQHLQEKEAQLEALKLSESRLEAAGLGAFLDEEVSLEPTQETPVVPVSTPIVVEELVMQAQPLETQAVAPSSMTVQATTAKFACAQTFLGYTQAKVAPNAVTSVSISPKDVEQLQAQMQQLMAQMAGVQAALKATTQAVNTNVQRPAANASLQRTLS